MPETRARYHLLRETAEAEVTDVQLITVEIEALTSRPDLLEAIVYNVVTEGLGQYHALGELVAFDTLRVLQSPAHALTQDELRLRRLQEDRIRQMHPIVEKRLTFKVEPATQLTMPGLE
jgi:hypothetical protein